MPYTKGRPLCPEEKKFLVSVKHYFDRNKAEFGSSESSVQMTADALGIGLATVNRVMATYRKDPDSLTAPPQLRGRLIIMNAMTKDGWVPEASPFKVRPT